MQTTLVEGIPRLAHKTRWIVENMPFDEPIVHFSGTHADLDATEKYYKEMHGDKNIEVLHLISRARQRCQRDPKRTKVWEILKKRDPTCPMSIVCKSIIDCPLWYNRSCSVAFRTDETNLNLYDVVVSPYQYMANLSRGGFFVPTKDRHVVIDEVDYFINTLFQHLNPSFTLMYGYYTDKGLLLDLPALGGSMNLSQLIKSMEVEQKILDVEVDEFPEITKILQEKEYDELQHLARDFEPEIEQMREGYSDFIQKVGRPRGINLIHLLHCLEYLTTGIPHPPVKMANMPSWGVHSHQLLFPERDKDGIIPIYNYVPRDFKKIWYASATVNKNYLEKIFHQKITEHIDRTPTRRSEKSPHRLVRSIHFDHKITTRTSDRDVMDVLVALLERIFKRTSESVMITFPNIRTAEPIADESYLRDVVVKNGRQIRYTGLENLRYQKQVDHNFLEDDNLVIINFSRSGIERGVQIRAPIHILAGNPLQPDQVSGYMTHEYKKMGVENIGRDDWVMPSIIQSSSRVIEQSRGALLIFLTDCAIRVANTLEYPKFWVDLMNSKRSSKMIPIEGGIIDGYNDIGLAIMNESALDKFEEYVKDWVKARPINLDDEALEQAMLYILYNFGNTVNIHTEKGLEIQKEIEFASLRSKLLSLNVKITNRRSLEFFRNNGKTLQVSNFERGVENTRITAKFNPFQLKEKRIPFTIGEIEFERMMKG